jgi:hypothetical protein
MTTKTRAQTTTTPSTGGTTDEGKRAPRPEDRIEEETPRAAAAQERRAEEGDATEVVYTGYAGTREITKAQWKRAGVEDQDTTIWSAENDFSLPVSDFKPEALALLAKDRNLKIK